MRTVKRLLSAAELEKLNTKRLLAYKNKLMKAHEDQLDVDDLINKQNPEWQETYAALKQILSTRENIK